MRHDSTKTGDGEEGQGQERAQHEADALECGGSARVSKERAPLSAERFEQSARKA